MKNIKKMSLSFDDWERLSQAQCREESTDASTLDDFETFGAILEKNLKSQENEDENQNNNNSVMNKNTSTVYNSVINLCRVCSSNGLISISQTMSKALLKYRQRGEAEQFNVQIAKVMEEVSGEEVSKIREKGFWSR